LGKELLDCYHWSDQVAVGGDKKGGIEIVVEGVLHQLDGNIHVRHRFVRDVMYMAAAPAGKRIELIPTIENREIGARLEGIRVRALALHLVRGRAHPRGRHRAQFAPRGSAGFCALWSTVRRGNPFYFETSALPLREFTFGVSSGD
jgi:hypothetical protein